MCVSSKSKLILKQNSYWANRDKVPWSANPKKLNGKICCVRVQRSSAHSATSDSAQTNKLHVTYQVKAQPIVYRMVCVLCSESKCRQRYDCLTTVGVNKMPQKEWLLCVSSKPMGVKTKLLHGKGVNLTTIVTKNN